MFWHSPMNFYRRQIYCLSKLIKHMFTIILLLLFFTVVASHTYFGSVEAGCLKIGFVNATIKNTVNTKLCIDFDEFICKNSIKLIDSLFGCNLCVCVGFVAEINQSHI